MEKTIDPSEFEPKVERVSDSSWIITLEEDPETGDLIMTLPTELLEQQGWAIGDTLVWDFNNTDKTATLKKKVL